MKTTMKQLATGTFLALLLMVGNVKAEATGTGASRNENMETMLQLEEWMTDETIWNTNSMNMPGARYEAEADLELEAWMTDNESWNLNYSFVKEAEVDLELEDWMIYDLTWNINSIENESELKIEHWMIDENFWK